MRLEHLDARCFLCGKEWPVFDTAHRACECLAAEGFAAGDLACYVSILPELRGHSVAALPSIWSNDPEDALVSAADSLGVPGDAVARLRGAGNDNGASPRPYPRDLLGTHHHARCGTATVYRSTSLEDLTGYARALVLDMGSYYWSGTLKDPRSWAIVNTALALGMTDISVWTAGNAGVSLAKIVSLANRRLPPELRLQVHAIVDSDVAPEIRTQLRLWQCEVLDVFRQDKPILNPDEIRSLVAARLRRTRRQLDDSTYWHVTDGWDGVGLLMYRLIGAQVIRDLAATVTETNGGPFEIVLPVGTGDLLLGFHLGLRDCEREGLVPPAAFRLVGALPAGANILNNVRQRTMAAPADRGHTPVMPKLTSLYTPLAPCLARLDRDGVTFVSVTEADQLRAARQILSGGIDDGVVAEPSALAAFAALPHLELGRSREDGSGNGRHYPCARRVLVVSSGHGVVGPSEEALLHRAIGF
jgi:Pyridoxal-phosphate dependent enzyme